MNNNFELDENLKKYILKNNLENFQIGRIIAEHKERYVVRTEGGEFEAEITGNMRFNAESREDFPAVGDWVALIVYDNDLGIIHKILPRKSMLARQSVGNSSDKQIIASNIDYALLVQAVDRDFNINRLERYLTICYSGKVEPVVVLTKIDLISSIDLDEIISKIKLRLPDIPVFALSNSSLDGISSFIGSIIKGKTYCMLGSSGVGKSTLINNLLGKDMMKTNPISFSTNKGRHTTSHRELFFLESGAIFIDNPGMREVGLADNIEGLETTFDIIFDFARYCRYGDCSHKTEKGCAVIDAVANGSIDKQTYNNFLKMEKETAHYESSLAERRKKDKYFGKVVKDYLKLNVKNRNV